MAIAQTMVAEYLLAMLCTRQEYLPGSILLTERRWQIARPSRRQARADVCQGGWSHPILLTSGGGGLFPPPPRCPQSSQFGARRDITVCCAWALFPRIRNEECGHTTKHNQDVTFGRCSQETATESMCTSKHGISLGLDAAHKHPPRSMWTRSEA